MQSKGKCVQQVAMTTKSVDGVGESNVYGDDVVNDKQY